MLVILDSICLPLKAIAWQFNLMHFKESRMQDEIIKIFHIEYSISLLLDCLTNSY